MFFLIGNCFCMQRKRDLDFSHRRQFNFISDFIHKYTFQIKFSLIRMERAKCLLQRYSRESLQFPTTFPGKFMNLNEQCRRFTGGPPCEVSYFYVFFVNYLF
jgi:hypothetical protein